MSNFLPCWDGGNGGTFSRTHRLLALGISAWTSRFRGSHAGAQPAYRLQHIVGDGRHESLAVHFPQSSQPRLCPPQPVQRRKDSLDYGPTARHFSPIGGSLVPFLGLKVQRVIDGESQVPALLVRRKTLSLYRTSLAILLAGHVLVAGVAAVIASPLQHFPLGTNHMVSPVLKVPSGHHVRFLPGVNGNIGGDAPFFQDLSQAARIVGGVGRQRDRRQGEMFKQMGQGLPFPL